MSGDYAADCIIEHLEAVDQVAASNELNTLLALVQAIDYELERQQETQAALAGTGSTIVCVLWRDATVYWIHVGDSRLYLFRDGRLSQITQDQTLARFLIWVIEKRSTTRRNSSSRQH